MDRDPQPNGGTGAQDPLVAAVVAMVRRSEAPVFAVVDRDAVLVANTAVCRLLGVRSDLAGHPLRDVPAWDGLLAEPLARVRDGATVTLRRLAVPAREGQAPDRRVDVFLSPLSGGGALGVVSDATAADSAERDLSGVVRDLGLAARGAGAVAFWTYDDASRTVAVDDNIARTIANGGGTPDPQALLDGLHPEDRAAVQQEFRAAVAAGKPFRARSRLATGRYGSSWITLSAVPSAFAGGRASRMLGIVLTHDVLSPASDRSGPQVRFRTLTETLPQIVWSTDASGRHDYFSSRWHEYTGIPPESTTEYTWTDLVHPEDWERVEHAWLSSLRSEEPYAIDYRFRHRSGQYRWLRVMASPVRDRENEVVRWCGTSTDVDEMYRAAEERDRRAGELERLAAEDALTGVLTRRAFAERAGTVLDRPGPDPVTLLVVDLDHFKPVNDTHGHLVGDAVLAAAAARLAGAVGDRGLIGRWGGEEFLVLLPACGRAEALGVAERLRRAIAAEPVVTDRGPTVSMTVSIGGRTTVRPARLDDITVAADRAMYRAKALGRNRSVIDNG